MLSTISKAQTCLVGSCGLMWRFNAVIDLTEDRLVNYKALCVYIYSHRFHPNNFCFCLSVSIQCLISFLHILVACYQHRKRLLKQKAADKLA